MNEFEYEIVNLSLSLSLSELGVVEAPRANFQQERLLMSDDEWVVAREFGTFDGTIHQLLTEAERDSIQARERLCNSNMRFSPYSVSLPLRKQMLIPDARMNMEDTYYCIIKISIARASHSHFPKHNGLEQWMPR